MAELRAWMTLSWTVTLVASTSCSSVDCPAGAVEKQGQCIQIDALQDDGGVPGSGASGEGVSGTAANGGGGASGGTAGTSRGDSGNGGSAASGSGGNSGPGTGGAGTGGGNGPGMNTSGNGSQSEACSTPDAVRCSMTGAGNREKCSNGTWTADEACPSGQTCVTEPSGEPKCVMVAELCRGSGGQTICDAQGSLVVCNADESIGMMMACDSAKHCQAGMATQTCATCIPGEDHQCTGVSLEQCAPDGMSFMKLMDCATEGLCNTMLGQCTDAVCEPGKKSCDGNKLITCNADGTAVQGMETCMNGMCDAEGGDCNVCQPGTKKCEGDMVLTCDATGQTWTPMACPGSAPKCVGLGQCVQCAMNDDCSDLTQGCKVGRCMQNRCMAANAPNGGDCDAAGGKPGMCSNGNCMCAPQCSGKECGSDGCSSTCGNCTGGDMCNTSGQCVECLDDGDCTDGGACQTGRCSSGTCTYTPRNSGTCNIIGICRSGECCIPDCSGGRCGTDPECGTACPRCTGGQSCNPTTDRCEAPRKQLHDTCEPGGSNLQGNCEDGLVCQTIIDGGFRCYDSTSGGCRTNTVSFMGIACVQTCDPDSASGFCDFPTACISGWCIPTN